MTDKSKQVDDKRKRGEEMLKQGMRPKEVADRLRVPASTAGCWAQRMRKRGDLPPVGQRAKQKADTGADQEAQQPEGPAAPPSVEQVAQHQPTGPKASEEPGAIYIRNTTDLQVLRIVPRIKQLATRAGFPESMIARSLLMLGLVQAEQNPAAMFQAAALARGE